MRTQNKRWRRLLTGVMIVAGLCCLPFSGVDVQACAEKNDAEIIEAKKAENQEEKSKKYIKWIDFSITKQALNDTMNADIESVDRGEGHRDWVTLLSLLGVRYGGDFSRYSRSDLDEILKRLDTESPVAIAGNEKWLRYYLEAYGAVLGGMVGPYKEIRIDVNGQETVTDQYGLRAFSPIAAGYGYSHYDDFGAARSYGYKRPHLGHDLMGSVGTPIIAIESGYIEHLGWNQYGGWRVGIRSLDGKRYYYYAHLRRGHPFTDLHEGDYVDAGQVIGYLGMTGYSAKEDVNNIDTPHLHVGLQVIFDVSQIEGWNQIWIDMNEITEFLAQNRAQTFVVPVKDEGKTAERVSARHALYPEMPEL